MTNLESLVITLSLKYDQLVQGLKATDEKLKALGEAAQEAQEKIKDMSERSASLVDALKEHVVGLMGALASVGAFMAFTEHTMKAGTEMVHLSEETKMSVENISLWQNAVIMAGGSAEGFNHSLKHMGETLSDIEKGMPRAKRALVAFQAAGITGLGKGVHTEITAVFEKAHTALGKLQAKGDVAGAMSLGRRMGFDNDTVRVLMKTGDAYDEFMAKAKAAGTVTKEQAEAAHEAEEAQHKMRVSIDRFAETIVQMVLPAMMWLTEKLAEFAQWARTHPQVINAALKTMGILMAILAAHAVRMSWNMMIAWLASGLAALKAGVVFLATGKVGETGGYKVAWAWLKAAASFVWAGICAMAAGVQAHAAWLLALGPIGWVIGAIEILIVALVAAYAMFPKFRAIVNTVFGYIKDYIKFCVESIIDVFGAWWEAVKAYFGFLVALVCLDTDKIQETWKNLVEKLDDLWATAWWSIRNQFLVAGFKILEAMDDLWDKLKDNPMFQVFAQMSGLDISVGTSAHQYVEEIHKGVDKMSGHAQSPATVNAANNDSSGHLRIDNIDVIAPEGTTNPMEWAREIAYAINPLTRLLSHAEH